jgi:hypothetical protein
LLLQALRATRRDVAKTWPVAEVDDIQIISVRRSGVIVIHSP